MIIWAMKKSQLVNFIYLLIFLCKTSPQIMAASRHYLTLPYPNREQLDLQNKTFPGFVTVRTASPEIQEHVNHNIPRKNTILHYPLVAKHLSQYSQQMPEMTRTWDLFKFPCSSHYFKILCSRHLSLSS